MSFFNKTVWEPRRFDIGAGPPLGQLAPFTRSRFICVSLKISSSENGVCPPPGVCPPLPTSETGLLLQTALPAGFGADLKGSGSLELQQSTSSGWQEGAKRRACSPSREARQSLLRVLTRTAPGPKRAGKAEQCRAIQSLARGRSSSCDGAARRHLRSPCRLRRSPSSSRRSLEEETTPALYH